MRLPLTPRALAPPRTVTIDTKATGMIVTAMAATEIEVGTVIGSDDTVIEAETEGSGTKMSKETW